MVDPLIFLSPPISFDEGWDGALVTMAVALVPAPGAVEV
jgi:hypothetical protein